MLYAISFVLVHYQIEAYTFIHFWAAQNVIQATIVCLNDKY